MALKKSSKLRMTLAKNTTRATSEESIFEFNMELNKYNLTDIGSNNRYSLKDNVSYDPVR
jgi:hypothetical protein